MDALVVFALVAVVCVPVWPGVFTVDSQAIQRAVRYNDISDWYAPLHLWGWALVDRVASAGLVLFLGVSAFVASVLSLTRQFLSARAARASTGIIVLFPPVYGLLGWVGRDVWFATAAMAVAAAAYRVHRQGQEASSWLLVALVVFGAAAADARQNGLPFGILAVGVAVLAVVRRRRPGARFPFRAGAVVLGVVVFWGALLLAQRAVMTRDQNPEEVLFASDLVAVSLRTGRPALDRSLFPAQDVTVLRAGLAGRQSSAVVDLDPPVVKFDPHGDTFHRLWMRQWRRMIVEQPGPYLRWRLRLYLEQLGVTHPPRVPYYTSSVMLPDGLGAQVMREFPRALDARNRVLSWTGSPQTGSAIHAPWFYVAAACVAAAALGRSTGERRAAFTFGLLLLGMQALLFFTAPASEFRLEYFQVVLGTNLSVVVIALHVPIRRPAWFGRVRGDHDADSLADAGRSASASRC